MTGRMKELCHVLNEYSPSKDVKISVVLSNLLPTYNIAPCKCASQPVSELGGLSILPVPLLG